MSSDFPFFPHDRFRPGQKEGLEAIRDAAESGAALLFDSPTGTGKTAMVLGGVLAAREEGEKLAVITRTHSQYRMFIEEFMRIKERHPSLKFGLLVGRGNVCPMRAGYDVCGMLRRNSSEKIRKSGGLWYGAKEIEIQKKKVLLGSKESVCPYFMNCFKPYEKKAFSKDAMELVGGQMDSPRPAEEFMEECLSHMYPKCPYELMKASLRGADVMVLHYQYILDPEIRRIVSGANWLGAPFENIHLVVDEAHNLADYMQGIAAVECTREDLLDAVKLLLEGAEAGIKYPVESLGGEDIKKVVAAIEGFNEFMKAYFLRKANRGPVNGEEVVMESCEFGAEERVLLGEAADLVRSKFGSASKDAESGEETRIPSICRVADVVSKMMRPERERFIKTINVKPTSDTAASTLEGTMDVRDYELTFKVADVDARDAVGGLAESFRSLSCISGTLHPTGLFRKLLFHPDFEVREVNIPSPFPKENRLVLCCSGASSERSVRDTQKNVAAIKYCLKALFSVPGNVAVFFTGYDMKRQYLEYAKTLALATRKEVMDEARDIDKQRFIESYKSHGNAALLGVCRGSFSEGVDYIGDAMNAVAVIGLPLAQWNTKQRMINRYFQSAFGRDTGDEIAYKLPAVMAAVQALGRCIRDADDRGVLILADARYCRDGMLGVNKLLPGWLKDEFYVTEAQDAEKMIKERLALWAKTPRKEKKREAKKEEKKDGKKDGLYEALLSWRKKKSESESIVPHRILSDSALQAIAATRPASVKDLAAIKGVPAARAKEYGRQIVEQVNSFAKKEGAEALDVDYEILSAVRESKERYGSGRIAELLSGSKNREVLESGLDRLGCYGRLSNVSQSKIEERIGDLLDEGFLSRTHGLYPLLKLTEKGDKKLSS